MASLNQDTPVETIQILYPLFVHFLKDYPTVFPKTYELNEVETATLNKIIYVIDIFLQECGDDLRRVVSEIDTISPDTIEFILTSTSNELFSKGITWIGIVTYLAFVVELARYSVEKELGVSIPHLILIVSSRIVFERLDPWINIHHGWKEIGSYLEEAPINTWRTKLFSFLLNSFAHPLFFFHRLFTAFVRFIRPKSPCTDTR